MARAQTTRRPAFRGAKPSNRRNKPARQRVEWIDRDKARKTLNVVAMTVLIVASGLGLWRAQQWVMNPANLPIRHVAVKGELPHMDVEALREDIRQQVTGGFFGLDLDAVRESLERHPWIYKASVRRQWPDRLEIVLVEQKPIARWGEHALLNAYGEIFEAEDTNLPLPLIVGEPGREKVLIEAFVKSDQLLRTVGLDLVGLHEDARHNQTLILANGIKMALGRRDQDERLRRFVTAYNDTLEGFVDRIKTLDLRYTNGFSVGWGPEGTGLIGS